MTDNANYEYHGAECDDTIKNASLIEKTNVLNDNSYYLQSLKNMSKRNTVDTISDSNEEAKIVKQENVNKFETPIEESAPMDVNNSPSPSKHKNEDLEELMEDLEKRDAKIKEFESELESKDNEIQKWKKKLNESKAKADKKEETINKLLKENDKACQSNVQLEEQCKNLELDISSLKKEKEASEQLLQSLQETTKHSNKENKPEETITVESQANEINKLQKVFNQERTELKNQLLNLQNKNQKLSAENKSLVNSEAKAKKDISKMISANEESQKDEIFELTIKHDEEVRKAQSKCKREVEILHEKMYIKDNQITELQKLISDHRSRSVKVSTKPGEDLSKISEKIRLEYVGAVETMEANLETLKSKYQKEVAARKNETLKHKEEIRDLKRKIKILEEELEMLNRNVNSTGKFSNKFLEQSQSKNFKDEAFAEKCKRIDLEQEKDLLMTVLGTPIVLTL